MDSFDHIKGKGQLITERFKVENSTVMHHTASEVSLILHQYLGDPGGLLELRLGHKLGEGEADGLQDSGWHGGEKDQHLCGHLRQEGQHVHCCHHHRTLWELGKREREMRE